MGCAERRKKNRIETNSRRQGKTAFVQEELCKCLLSDRNRINESPSSLPSSWPDLIRPSTGPALGIDRVDTRLIANHLAWAKRPGMTTEVK
jgi:hypothetical protein